MHRMQLNGTAPNTLTSGLMRRRNCDRTESPWTASSGLEHLRREDEDEDNVEVDIARDHTDT